MSASDEEHLSLVESQQVHGNDLLSEDINLEQREEERNSNTSSMASFASLSDVTDSINPHRSLLYIVLLSIIVGGLQLSWCTEFSEGTPFLLSLGISKHTLALVWIAGPLSGSIGQPIIGIFSDNSQFRYGRRKLFIIGGCIATSLSLFYLSYSIDLVSLFFDKATDEQKIRHATIPFAAAGVYMLDFSISAIQAASRAFIVDNVGSHQQQLANAMAAIMIGGFNILGYFLGSINLVNIFTLLGNTQFKVLAAIASMALILSCIISLSYVKERNPRTDAIIKAERKKSEKRLRELGVHNPTNMWGVVVALFKQTTHSIKRLPPQVKIVCLAEFFAWIGYFPMLFYTTTYVGDIYKYEFFQNRDPSLPPLTPSEQLELNDQSTRRGAVALLLHSITSFAVDLILPVLTEPFKRYAEEDSEIKLLSSGILIDTLEKFRLKFTWWLTVRKSWYLSHALFIICMASTFFVRSSSAAIVLFGILGITWGTALWAPFVLISEEISRIKEIKTKTQEELARLNTDETYHSTMNLSAVERFDNYEHEAGIILGIHNFFVAAPQVISSLLSSVLFKLLSNEDNDGSQYDDSLGWVFRFGGLATIGALVLSIKVKPNETLLKEESELFNAEI